MSEIGGSGVYPWMWRHLPGPWPVRLLVALALVVAVVAVLFQWGFPQLAPLMPFNDGTVTSTAVSSTAFTSTAVASSAAVTTSSAGTT